jgi:uncharacterized protein
MTEEAVRYFVVGAGVWRQTATWPPPAGSWEAWQLASQGQAGQHDGGGQLTTAPTPCPDATTQACESFTYDPADPLPTLWTPEFFTVPADRRAHHGRRDLLYYRSAPLTEAQEFVGEPVLMLYVSSSAPDTDFFVWLVDEAPDGTALDVSSGMVRLRHRGGINLSFRLPPGEVALCKITLRPTAFALAPGHRLRLEISSSDFPNHDRNHNVGRDDFFDAELQIARNSVWHTPARPSRLLLPRL